MEAISRVGIVHGDLSPGNILLGFPVHTLGDPEWLAYYMRSLADTSAVIIIDFGESGRAGKELTSGTRGFYDDRAKTASVATDIYAFACVALFLFVGEAPEILFVEETEEVEGGDETGERRTKAQTKFAQLVADQPFLAGLLVDCLKACSEDRPSWEQIRKALVDVVQAFLPALAN